MPAITVIGSGNMGAPMAINLAQTANPVCVFDIVPAQMTGLANHGIIIASSHRQAIENADVILTMLPTGVEVNAVYQQVIAHAKPATLLIDSSTIDLQHARQMHRKAAQHGFAMLDAPVSGGTGGAKSATLTFMVGGAPATLEQAKPILAAMGNKIVYCGQGGMGQAAKMCNNMMLGIQMASVVEGFHLAKRVGLSAQKLYEVAANASANCWSLTAFCPVPDIVPAVPASNDYQPGFANDLMLKDMRLALSAASNAGLTLDLAPVAAALYQQCSDIGNGELDFSALYKLPKLLQDKS